MDAPRFPTTKIQPPRSRAVRVERPLLDATVTEALLDCRVVLLQAPGGFGKTSTLAAQLARLPAGTALAWVSMDEDDDPRRLLACLAAALEAHDLPWRTSPEALVAQLVDDGVTLRRAVAELVNALAGAEAPRGVIVLDDLHRVQHTGVHALLDALIERLPDHWTLALSTRASLMSMTTRSGFCSVNTLCSTGAERSNTSRVPSGPAQRRTALTVAGGAACANAVSSSARQPMARMDARKASRCMVAGNLPRSGRSFQLNYEDSRLYSEVAARICSSSLSPADECA